VISQNGKVKYCLQIIKDKEMIVSYTRCSTDKQNNSIEVQSTEIKRYCEYKGLEVDKSFVDYAVSGKNFDREQFQEMIELVEKGQVQEIIITELSRWGRNMLEALQNINILKKHKCNLVVLKENIDLNSPSGNLLTNILFSLAEWERNEIALRTSKTLQDKKSKGLQYTKRTYGYNMINGKMVENHKELRMLKKIEKMKLHGKSYNEIKDFLNRNNYTRKNGTNWNRDSVIKLVKNRLKITNSMTTNY
jgi:site-specific DNA recombinase